MYTLHQCTLIFHTFSRQLVFLYNLIFELLSQVPAVILKKFKNFHLNLFFFSTLVYNNARKKVQMSKRRNYNVLY